MSTSPKNASTGQSTTPNIFGPPPLLKGEDPKAYDDLLLRVFGAVNPSDVFEEIWTRDFVDLTWEVLRWRRLKASLLTGKMTDALERLIVFERLIIPSLDLDDPGLEDLSEEEVNDVLGEQPDAKMFAQEWAAGVPSAIKRVRETLASIGATMESVQGLALELALDSVDRIERLAMSAEARRNAAWREINRHRDRREFARSLHDEVCAIEKAELQSIGTKTIAPVAATERNVA